MSEVQTTFAVPQNRIIKNIFVRVRFQGRWYTAIVQVRVNPRLKKVVFNDGGDEYWVVSQANAVRAYGVCVYDITRPI